MNVLIADKFEQAGIDQLRSLGCTVNTDADLTGDSLRMAVGSNGCEVLIVRSTKVSDDVLAAGSSLKLIIRAGAGFDTIDTAAAKQRGIKVANCPGMNSVAVAELTFGLMLGLDRRIPDNVSDLRGGVWNKKEYGKARGLKGRTLGIVGLGRIGYEVAVRGKAFDMDLIYSDVIAHESKEQELGIRRVSYEEVLRESDFICLHVPLNDETRHMISTPQFETMKSTAFIINCSRGGVIDEKALATAIETGQIAGAGLDVYEHEPKATDKTCSLDVARVSRVYGTHHIGASTEQAQLAVAQEVVRIVGEFKTTGEVLNWVNP